MASRATTDPIEILLEMGIDLDNLSEEEDYLSALKEAIAIILVKTKGAGDERSRVLLDEVVKVRKSRKAADPTFKVKKTKITADSFKKQSPTAGAAQKALPETGKGGALVIRKTKVDLGALVKPGGEEQEQSILEKILASVNSILGTLREDQNRKKKTANQERRKGERSKRKGKEDKLESGIFKGLVKGVQKVLKPVEGILSRILKFIGTILIGKILQKIVDWMSDPKNEGKLEAIGDFLKNTWPLLLAAYLLFGNSLGRFATKLIGSVIKFSAKLLKKLIPGLLKGIKRLGLKKSLGVGALVVGGGMLAGRIFDGGEDDKQPEPSDGKDKSEPPSVSGRFDMEAGQGYINDKPVSLEEYQSFTNMSADEKAQKYAPPKEMSKGGTVPGSGNKDTVPAMLTPGEYVMSKGAVQKYGRGTMESMNAMGGGSGIPSFGNGMMYASSGGEVPEKNEPGGRNKTKSDDEGGGLLGSIGKMFGLGKPPTIQSSPTKDDDKKNSESSGSGISKNAKALLNTIRWAEGTLKPDGYNTWFGGRSDMDLTKMSINEVVAEQKSRLSSGKATYGSYTSAAVGAYQMMKPDAFASAAGLSGDSLFTPANQDKMAIAGYMMGQARMSQEEIDAPINRGQIAKMAPVWASLPMANGQSRYGQPVKRYEDLASVYNKNLQGLDPSSFSSTTNIASGVTPSRGGSSSGSSSGEGSSSTEGGGGFGGLLTLAKMQKISRSSSSSTSSSSSSTSSSSSSTSSSSTSSASLGSKPSPSAPPAPPTKATPKVVMDSGGSGGSSSGQQTPISEASSKVPLVPSPINSKEKMAVLGIS
jgi:muramidase (phage lysozyme)